MTPPCEGLMFSPGFNCLRVYGTLMQPTGGLLIVFCVAGKITPWGGGGADAPRLAVDGHAVG